MQVLALLSDAYGCHGGIAKFNRDLLAALCVVDGISAIVAVPRYAGAFEATEIPYKVSYPTTGTKSQFSYVVTALRHASKENPFDFILCGHINLLPVALLLKQIFGFPIVLMAHGIDVWKPPHGWFARSLVGRVDAYISVSELTRERLLSWAPLSGKPGFILPNSVNLSGFAPGPKPEYLLKRYNLAGKKVLLTLGRLVSKERAKGFDEVLSLLPELAKTEPDIAYVIAGDGPDRERLKQKADVLGVGNRVVFTSFVNEKEKADHYRIADLYVMPSRGEGFGIVYLEALACGVPVIGSSVDGSREALRGGELGTLIDPDNTNALLAAILGHLHDEHSVPSGLEYFSYQHFCHRVKVLFEELALKFLSREHTQP